MNQLSIVLLFLFFGTRSVIACSCGPKLTLEESVAQNELIAVGTITSVEEVVVEHPDGHVVRKMMRYGLVPDVVLKGEAADTLFVLDGRDRSECGFVFETGKSYLIYADQVDVKWNSGAVQPAMLTGRCTRTRLKDDEEISAIRKLIK